MPLTLLTARELAEKLGADYHAVLEWARDGEIPSIRVEGRVFFNLARVVNAIRQRQQAEAEAVPA